MGYDGTMIDRILRSLPRIYSLSPNSDYGRFVPKESVEELTRQRWEKIGERLYQAFNEIESDILKHGKTEKKKTEKQNYSRD